MRMFVIQISFLLLCLGFSKAEEKWVVDTENEVPPIHLMKFVDNSKDILIGTGSNGMLIFSTDGGVSLDAYKYTNNDWVAIESNEEVVVFGGRNFSGNSSDLLAYTYDYGETVNVVNVEKTEGIYNISLRDYPTVYYCTREGKVFKSDSNFTDWQEYADIDFKVFYSEYDDFGNLWLSDKEGNLFKSTDNGKTYSIVAFQDKDYKIINMYNRNGYLIMDVVSEEDVALCTSDGGETWKTVYNSKDAVLLDMWMVNENLIYASNFKGGFGSDYFRSTDGGETFETFEGIASNDSTFLQFCFKDESYGFAYGDKNFYGYLVRYTNDTGIEEYITTDEEIKITPNPSSEILHFTFEGLVESLEIVDLKGHCYDVKEQGKQIDISNLAPGTYFLKIESQNKAYIKQFVVAR